MELRHTQADFADLFQLFWTHKSLIRIFYALIILVKSVLPLTNFHM